MGAIRTVMAVIGGYGVYILLTMALMTLVMTWQNLLVGALAWLALGLIGILAGSAVRAIARGSRRYEAFAVAAFVGVANLANLFFELGTEPTWYKVGTLVMTVPAILWAALGRQPSAGVS